MAMTAEVKDELSRLLVNSVSARRAEVASLLRFAGGLHIVSGRVVVEAEVDLGIIARRLRKDIYDLYGYTAVVHVLSASGELLGRLPRPSVVLGLAGRVYGACERQHYQQHYQAMAALAESSSAASVPASVVAAPHFATHAARYSQPTT